MYSERRHRLTWRESVRDWSDSVIARAVGGHSNAIPHTIAAFLLRLTLTLYVHAIARRAKGARQAVREECAGQSLLTPTADHDSGYNIQRSDDWHTILFEVNEGRPLGGRLVVTRVMCKLKQ